jgi:hypothetical protein
MKLRVQRIKSQELWRGVTTYRSYYVAQRNVAMRINPPCPLPRI